MNRRTRKIAGTLSSTSLTSSPMRWSAPVQQGHAVVSGSIVTSQRGRCLGKAPILRFRLFRDPGAALVLWSSLAGGGRAASVSASPRPSDNCSAMMTALFSDRAPNIIVFSVVIVACKASILPSQRGPSRSTDRGREGGFRGEAPCLKTNKNRSESPAKSGVSSDFTWPFNSLPRNQRPIQSRHQNRQLRRRQRHHAVLNRRKREPAFLKPFCYQHHASSIPDDHLDPVLPFRPEDKNIAAIGIPDQRLRDHRNKTVHATAEVDRARRHQ